MTISFYNFTLHILLVDSLHHILCPLAIVLDMCNVGMLDTSVVVSTHFHVTDFFIVAVVFTVFIFVIGVSGQH